MPKLAELIPNYQQLKEHGMSDNDLKDIYRMRLKAYNESKDKEVAKLKDILPDYQDYLDKGLTEEQVIKIAKARVSLENTKKESLDVKQSIEKSPPQTDNGVHLFFVLYPIIVIVLFIMLYKLLKHKNNNLSPFSFLGNLFLGFLYILIFMAISWIFSKYSQIDAASYIGEQIFILFAAYTQYTSKDFFRSVFILSIFSFLGLYGVVDNVENMEQVILIHFLKDFVESFLLINITTFLFVLLRNTIFKIDISKYLNNTIQFKNAFSVFVKSIKFILIFIYFALGILMVLFPPSLHLKGFYQSKFNFILNTEKVDIYFFSYEVVSYLLIGFLMYFIYTKLLQKKETRE